jgi:hypothetical protein
LTKIYTTLFLAGVLSLSANAGTIPAGWTCTGSCGEAGVDGVVTLSPVGDPFYEYASTSGGTTGVGVLPTGPLGSEINGSTLATSTFSATAGTALNFDFNYITSDGAGFADYAWAALFNSDGTLSQLLFTARTESSGTIVPGSGMPAVGAGVTLNPASVPIIAGAPIWSPLGGSSNTCFADGCGYTGWVQSSYTIPTAGNYFLEVGTVNWLDDQFDSGIAMDGVTVGGVAIGPSPGDAATPEPSSLLLLSSGLAGLLYFGKRRLQR